MKRKSFCLFYTLIIFSAGLLFAQEYPLKYKEDCGLEQWQFFNQEYRAIWNTLSEEEQFLIACSANVFERNGQYHLDLTNQTYFEKNTITGKYILNDRWNVYNKEDLLKADKEIEETGQAPAYRKLLELLTKYPDLPVVKIGEKEELTVTQVSRLYLIKELNSCLGIHGIDAWDDSRRIDLMRWGMSAGYLTKEEGLELLQPIYLRMKNNYRSFEDFFAHWLAGFCYDAVFKSTCPECTLDIFDALIACRAYVPFEELAFSGQNADPNHTMTYEEGAYTPTGLAVNLIPVQMVYKRYWNDKHTKEILQDLIEVEKACPEFANLTMYAHVELLNQFGTAAERIEYIESKEDFLNSLGETSDWRNKITKWYFRDLLNTYSPEKLISTYNKLPASMQADNENYFGYGYANILLSNLSTTVIERDIYILRAKDVLKRLEERNYNIGDFLRCWINAVESL